MDKNKQRQNGTSVSGKTNNRIKTRKNKSKQGESEAFSDTNAADDLEIEDLALDISEEEIPCMAGGTGTVCRTKGCRKGF